ncbi:MAG TPA: HDIG domain-containing protein [Firmicutes bacterium]|nr:HDIG domain-containing protein [Candidatus Fermentithermobacillaceae bacterium]
MVAKPEKEARSKNNKDKLSFQAVLNEIARWRWEIIWGGAAFLVMFTTFFLSLMPQPVGLQAGDVSPIDIKAPREVIDVAATEALRQQAAANVPEQWEKDPKVLADLKAQVSTFRETVARLQAGTPTTQEIIGSLRPFLGESMSDSDIIALAASQPELLDIGIAKLIAVLEEGLGAGIKSENLASAKAEMVAALASSPEIPASISKALGSFVEKNLKANWVLNEESTERERRKAAEAVEPVRIRRGQFIVREGDIVTDEQMAILEELGMVGPRVRFTAVAGALLMSALVIGIVYFYLRAHHPDVLGSQKVAVLSSVLMVSVVAIGGMAAFSGFLIPAATGVLLVSTLFDRRFGVLFSACMTLVAGTVTGFDVRFMALALSGGLTASLILRSDWNRMHLIRAGFVVALTNTATYIGLGLTGTVPWDDILSWRDMLMVMVDGPFSAVLAVGLLPLFEAAFGIITPIKLLELSNPEHPLLHRLLLEAPGTYHHSIMVANLAEAAAMAIGADSLLARVGAYYHDIGKIKRPYFFTENQIQGMENPHDKMSPTLSATVIMSHVKDGLELAREHKVPQVIQDFIVEHHGTMLASYFYNKAAESSDRVPEEWDFRYEGPRPRSKETAVVMLADGVEAAVRSLSKPTPARIESVVRKIINDRLLDHQLDRCDLTLKELDIVSETFTKVLAGMFHTRIEYPEQKAK